MRSKKIRVDAKNVIRRNVDLTSEIWKRNTQAMLESAPLKVVTKELAKVKSKQAAIRVDCAYSRWGPPCVAYGTNKVEDDVSKALVAASGEVVYAGKWKVSIIASELISALKRMSIQLETESQAAISRLRSELKRSDSDV